MASSPAISPPIRLAHGLEPPGSSVSGPPVVRILHRSIARGDIDPIIRGLAISRVTTEFGIVVSGSLDASLATHPGEGNGHMTYGKD